MNIHFHVAYAFDKQLAKYYNSVMDMYPDEDYVCFSDADSMYTSNDIGHKLKSIVEANPDYGLLTCVTNRVGCPYQLVQNMWWDERINEHWRVGEFLWQEYGTDVYDITTLQPLSGVLMLINVGAFKQTGGFSGKGMLGVDNSIHRTFAAHGKKVGLMRGIYLIHYYRSGHPENKGHLNE